MLVLVTSVNSMQSSINCSLKPANAIAKLANLSDIFNNDEYSTPEPMDDEDFEKFFKSFI